MLKYVKETFKNSFIYGIGNISVKLVGFVLVPFLTNPEYLSIEDYGALGVFEAISQILVFLLGLGLFNSLFRWYYEQSEKENKSTFFTASILVALLVLSVVFISFLFREQLSILLFNDTNYQDILLLVIFSTGLQAVGILPATLMRLQDRAAFFTSSNIFKLFVTLIVTLYYLLILGDGLKAIYIGQIAGFLSYLVLLIPYVSGNINFRIHIPVFKEMMGYGISMMIAGAVAASVNVLDRFVLNSHSGLEEVGLYSLGYKISSLLKVFIIGSVSMAITPIIFRKINDEDNNRFYTKTMTYYGFVMMICIMGISLFSKEFLKVFTGSTAYWASFSVIPVLAFSMFFVALKDIVVTGLHITKKTSRISITTAIISGTNLLLNFILIPYLGAMGAAVASLISQALYFGGLFYFSNKAYPIQFEWYKITLMFVLGAILVFAALLTTNWPLMPRLAVKIAAILLFPLLLYPFNFYEKAELRQIKIIWYDWRNPKNWSHNIKRLFT